MSTRADYADQSADHADARGCRVNVHHVSSGEVNMCLQVSICPPGWGGGGLHVSTSAHLSTMWRGGG